MCLRLPRLQRHARLRPSTCAVNLSQPPRCVTQPGARLSAWPQDKQSAAFNTTTCKRKKGDQLPPRPTLPDSEIKHVYLKGSGPGGQKINKTSSAVQLTHLPTGLVVKSQATRSRSQNHTIAKRILAEKIEHLEKGEESRVAKKIERLQRKKASSGKKKRRKYRKLEEDQRGARAAEREIESEEWEDVEDADLDSDSTNGERKAQTESASKRG